MTTEQILSADVDVMGIYKVFKKVLLQSFNCVVYIDFLKIESIVRLTTRYVKSETFNS